MICSDFPLKGYVSACDNTVRAAVQTIDLTKAQYDELMEKGEVVVGNSLIINKSNHVRKERETK